jgi:hypothetical protein
MKTQRFNPVFTLVCQLSLPRARSVQSTPSHPVSARSVLILLSHVCLHLSSGIFLSCFHNKILCAFLPSSIHDTCPACFILLDFIAVIMFGDEYESQSSILCNLVQFFLTSPFLGLIFCSLSCCQASEANIFPLI